MHQNQLRFSFSSASGELEVNIQRVDIELTVVKPGEIDIPRKRREGLGCRIRFSHAEGVLLFVASTAMPQRSSALRRWTQFHPA